ncbi:MAG: DegT/DnrJ/EryC1/StrS family aminotransferase [Patescibacteria group bacterium]
MNIPLSGPDITKKEIEAVVSVLKTSYLSLGPKLPEFEEKFAKYIDTKYAVALNSGTSALHLCIRALDIKDGDEVITTPFSFVASTNCFLFERAKPVFVDINLDTLNIDENEIESKITKKTKAIIPVHVFGYPANMLKIRQIAKKHNLYVIEDACEGIGAEIDKKKAGTFSDCAVFAFYPNKQMTTGEGGMLVTNNKKIAETAKSLRNQGRDTMAWLSHNRLGYNYRLSDINCALGLAQLDRISDLLDKRKKIAQKYNKALAGTNEIILPPSDSDKIKRSWFVYVIRLNSSYSSKQRDHLIELLKADGIGCNVYFPAIHLQPYLKEYGFKKGDFLKTEAVSERTIALPFYNKLTDKEIDYVVKRLKSNLLKVKK